jgi:hypothetical protein
VAKLSPWVDNAAQALIDHHTSGDTNADGLEATEETAR